MVGAIEAGLVRTAEDVLAVLKQAQHQIGPMGEAWLEAQARELRRDQRNKGTAGA